MGITRAEAEEIAAGWARLETERRGHLRVPMLAEFDLGFLVWTRRPGPAPAIPGDGGRTVIDRATGLLTTWPSVPVETVARLYRDRRPGFAELRRTLDPSVELLRSVRRRVTPTTAAHLTVGGRIFRARGAKGDQVIEHHPLVVRHLHNVDPGSLVRGCERHAELIVLSDALHAFGAATQAAARDLLRGGDFEAFFVREPGDPLAGEPARLCESCIRVLVDFAVLPWPELARAEPLPQVEPDGPAAEPGRFSEPVADLLSRAGWIEMNRVAREALATAKIEKLAAYGHRGFPAVERMMIDFPAVVSLHRGPGVRRAVRMLEIAPARVAHTTATLADLSAVLGVGLFPIGIEHGGDTLVAMDERGRIFGLDQAGEWYLGESIDEALTGLLTGTGPAARLRDDATW